MIDRVILWFTADHGVADITKSWHNPLYMSLKAHSTKPHALFYSMPHLKVAKNPNEHASFGSFRYTGDYSLGPIF